MMVKKINVKNTYVYCCVEHATCVTDGRTDIRTTMGRRPEGWMEVVEMNPYASKNNKFCLKNNMTIVNCQLKYKIKWKNSTNEPYVQKTIATI